jgi:hypothetical protein
MFSRRSVCSIVTWIKASDSFERKYVAIIQDLGKLLEKRRASSSLTFLLPDPPSGIVIPELEALVSRYTVS